MISTLLTQHLPVLPVILPMLTGIALLLLGDERHINWQRAIALCSATLAAMLSAALLIQAAQGDIHVYHMGNWPAPFGIVLVVDRLSALMLCMVSALAVPALWYACQGWDRRGRLFHPLYQFQLMGLYGAFLTGDLFNLFVFFEILLIASYALLLHGQGKARFRSGVHYVVLNLAGSAVFLIALALVYGLTGTLNMADVALRVMELASQPGEHTTLLRITTLLLLVVFSLKAAIIPLHLWLPNTYASASAPVAALFAIMTKVGIYAILRSQVLVFGPHAGTAFAAEDVLLPLALLTGLGGALGALASHRMSRLVAWLTIASVGTILLGIASLTLSSIAAALYYMLHSTLVMGAMFLLVDIVAQQRGTMEDHLQPANRVGQPVILGLLVLLGAASAAGLPPLPGFLGKLMLLQSTASHHAQIWIWAGILLVGLLTLICLARAGAALFWNVTPVSETTSHHMNSAAQTATPLGRLTPVLVLLGAVILTAVYAAPIKQYADATALQLLDVTGYARHVLGAQQHNGKSTSTIPYTGISSDKPANTTAYPSPLGESP